MKRFKVAYYMDRWVVLDTRTNAVLHTGFYGKTLLSLELLDTGECTAESFVWHSLADGKVL